uniref:Uncharacterized protein n=1 Tax=Brassica campestris TaxID=3711 RepID=A0A3P6B3F1_BRACM|nr:unnamed protein product [Brassica rapa]
MAISVLLAKPIAPTGSAETALCLFGGMDLHYAHANVPCAVVLLLCLFLLRIHREVEMTLQFQRFFAMFKLTTESLVDNQLVCLRGFKTFLSYSEGY